MSREAESPADRLLREIQRARAELPAEHRNLLEQIGAHEGVIDDWPHGVLDLYRSIRKTPPSETVLARAAAAWLDGLRTVVFNGPFMQEAVVGLNEETRGQFVAYLAWHEYGHALSLTRSSQEQREDGVRLLGLLSEGLRASIDYPGGYGRLEVFDEVIATVYVTMIARIRTDGYGIPRFLHPEVFQAFKEVIPWPPSH